MDNYLLLACSLALFAVGFLYGVKNMGATVFSRIIISITTTLFLATSLLFLAADYFTGNGIDHSVIFHLKFGLKGAGFGEYRSLIIMILLGLIASISIPYVLTGIIHRRLGQRRSKIYAGWLVFSASTLISFSINPATLGWYQHQDMGRAQRREPDPSFEKLYKEPWISQVSRKRNFVFIYAESFERTYFNEQIFPGLIEELRRLELKSTSFTQIKQLYLTGWTIAGLTASQCAIPLLTPSRSNTMNGMDAFLPKAICFGDLLSKEGYNLLYYSGTSLEFAGTGKLFSTHGFNEVYGFKKLVRARADLRDCNEWGLNDDTLYKVVLDKVLALSKRDQPFGLFLSTMDTHHPNGHLSKQCDTRRYNTGDNPILNAVSCSDHQMGKFIKGIMSSKEASDTVIIIASDHLAMRNTAADLLKKAERNNLFLVMDPHQRGKNIDRIGSMLDVGPTILPFLGFEGEMGLGRNLLVESSLASRIENFGDILLDWREPFQAFLDFPMVAIDGTLSISPRKKHVIINGRSFKYPLLIEFSDDRKTIIRFSLEAEDDRTSLPHYVDNIRHGKPFLWIDKCETMSAELPHLEGEYCLVYGKSKTKETIRAPLFCAMKIPFSDIYNPNIGGKVLDCRKNVKGSRCDVNRFIAHAGGKIGGSTYTNSLEALNHSYKRGFKLFELDIIKTSDDMFVAAHDWDSWQRATGYKGSLPPPAANFQKYKIKKRFTPLDMGDINRWFKEHQDAILVTDKVNSPLAFSRQFVDKKRLMMELFSLDAVREGVKAKIKSAMPSWGVVSAIQKNRVKVLKDLGVTDIAMSRREINDNIPLIHSMKDAGLRIYAFHINADSGRDEIHGVCHDMDHVYGLYADDFDFQSVVKCHNLMADRPDDR